MSVYNNEFSPPIQLGVATNDLISMIEESFGDEQFKEYLPRLYSSRDALMYLLKMVNEMEYNFPDKSEHDASCGCHWCNK